MVILKVKALIACIGLGYSLKKDEEADLKTELAKKLIDFGYVEEVERESNEPDQQPEDSNQVDLDVEQYHTGGGYYELPNGQKVRGKEKAEKALKELYQEKGDE